MKIAILTFEGFNELDSFIALGIINRLSNKGWRAEIVSSSPKISSLNGLTIQVQQNLEFTKNADVILFGSGSRTREVAEDQYILSQLKLDPTRQLIGAQCSGTLVMAKLGLIGDLPACTDLTTKPWVQAAGVNVIDAPFYSKGNLATAGGCMASPYLAAWVIAKLAGEEAAEQAVHYVAPVGQKSEYVMRVMEVISPFLI